MRETIDATPAGEQTVLAGAERITQAELAQKRAGEPLKPSKPQAACDLGLFSDARNQRDLF